MVNELKVNSKWGSVFSETGNRVTFIFLFNHLKPTKLVFINNRIAGTLS
jgi:hypothetical protein